MIYELVCHPDTPAVGIGQVSAQLQAVDGRPGERWVEFHVAFAADLALPIPVEPSRTDGLWKTTCFEVFLMPADGPEYVEINLSPSRQWAAYRFEGYRHGMQNFSLRFDPEIALTAETPGHFWLESELDVSGLTGDDVKMGLSAVIEERDGTKSYWALAHAPGPPDFHNRDCFIATLPAPSAA